MKSKTSPFLDAVIAAEINGIAGWGGPFFGVRDFLTNHLLQVPEQLVAGDKRGFVLARTWTKQTVKRLLSQSGEDLDQIKDSLLPVYKETIVDIVNRFKDIPRKFENVPTAVIWEWGSAIGDLLSILLAKAAKSRSTSQRVASNYLKRSLKAYLQVSNT